MPTLEQDYRKAVEKFQAGQLKPAEKLLLRINKRQPGIPDVLHLLGYIAMETDRPKIAARHLSDAVKKVPNNAGLYNLLGCAHLQGGNLAGSIEALSRAVSLDPALLDARFNLAGAMRDAGRLDDAENEYRRLIEQAPRDAQGHNALGRVMWDSGDKDAAIRCYTTALECDPEDAEVLVNMGIALADAERFEDACSHLEKARKLDPELPTAMYALVEVYLGMGDLDRARSMASLALRRTPGNAYLHRLLGLVEEQAGDIKQSFSNLEESRRLEPRNVGTLSALASLQEKANRLDEASDTVSQGLQEEPDHFGLKLVSARLDYRKGNFENALDALLAMDDDGETLHLRRDRYFDLGRVCDRLDDADRAFEYFSRGNELAARSWKAARFEKDMIPGYVTRNLDTVDEQWVSQWGEPYESRDEPQSPVFMVGFPRSGTTLLEQVLDSHPAMQVLQEEPFIEHIRNLLMEKPDAYPGILATLPHEEIREQRILYFELAGKALERDPKTLLIDKMPLNMVEAALIHRLFPDAKFILCLRHPCDVCLSCFMQSFELNAGMANFLTMESTARLYQLVMQLWQRYEAVLPLRVHKIKYEDLVEDFEGTTRALLDFLDLPWDAAVLDYDRHAARRNIVTPSYSQVTQKIYTRARHRWLRYEQHMQGVLGQLQPFIDAFGYGEGSPGAGD